MWPISSHASLHNVSDQLKDLNSDLFLDLEPPPGVVISQAYGLRFIPKILKILSSEDVEEDFILKALNFLLVTISDDKLKSECSYLDDGKVFTALLSKGSKNVKVGVCSVIAKLCEFQSSRNTLINAGLIDSLLENATEVPLAIADCFQKLTKNKDVIDNVLARENGVKTLVALLDDSSWGVKEKAATTLAALARKDEGIDELLRHDLAALLEGITQEESVAFRTACISTVMQMSHKVEAKIKLLGEGAVEALASCLMAENEVQVMATAALLGLSTEHEAKPKIAFFCAGNLMKLKYSMVPQLVSNVKDLIASVSEHPPSRKMFEKRIIMVM